jgi:HEAT repeat protein
MTRWNPILASVTAAWLSAGAASAATPPVGGPVTPISAIEDARQSREDEAYEEARNYIDSEQWQRAVERFDRVISMGGTKTDTALYWKAYAQSKLGQNADALATLATLNKKFPRSRTLEQARALEMDVRGASGQATRPENVEDEDLKLYALQALGNQDPEQAMPMLEKILRGTSSTKLKERALFVLAQMSDPRARRILAETAKDDAHPDVQSKAIQYLGVHGGRENRALLSEVYQSTSDTRVKKRVLQAWMISGEKDRILTAATSEKDPELRSAAVQQLGVMGAQDELSKLYASESSKDVKKKILQSMFIGGRSERLLELAKAEQDPDLRRTAVRNLGLMGAGKTGQALVDIYNGDKDVSVRKAVLEGLFIQNNAEALVALARKESDPDMKRAIVEKLSLIRSKVATDYLMELLK